MLEILRYWLRWLWPLYKCPGCKRRHNDHPGYCNGCFFQPDSLECYSRGAEIAVLATAFSLAGGVRHGVISLSTVLTVVGAVILFGGLLFIRHTWKEIQEEEREQYRERYTQGLEEHDPNRCGCKYIGMDMWDCGHTDGLTLNEKDQPDTDFMRWYCEGEGS